MRSPFTPGTERPCHYRELFVASNGEVYPCCLTWNNPALRIGHITDPDLEKRLLAFDGLCRCSSFTLRKGETIRRTRVQAERRNGPRLQRTLRHVLRRRPFFAQPVPVLRRTRPAHRNPARHQSHGGPGRRGAHPEEDHGLASRAFTEAAGNPPGTHHERERGSGYGAVRRVAFFSTCWCRCTASRTRPTGASPAWSLKKRSASPRIW